MALVAALHNTVRTWASILLITLFATEIAPYRFSKRGDASASWDVSAEKRTSSSESHSNSWASKKRRIPNDVRGYTGQVTGQLDTLRELNVQDGMLEAATARELVDIDVEYGMRELMSQVGELPAPGVPLRSQAPEEQPEAPPTPSPPPRKRPPPPNVPGRPYTPPPPEPSQPEAPSQPSQPETPSGPSQPSVKPPVVPVSVPVPSESDASIIVFEVDSRVPVQGVIETFHAAVNGPTRGFAFYKKYTCAVKTALEIHDQLVIPDDAASFVVPEAGIQSIKLSHPLLVRTDRPLVLVMEHLGSAQSQFSSRSGQATQTCPLQVVKDSSTSDLVMRQRTLVDVPSSDAVSEDIVGQVYGGKYDEETGAYKILKHRFSQPHKLVMHFLVKLGRIDPLSLLYSTKSMLKTEEGYKLILPLTDQLSAQIESEHISEAANLPVDRPSVPQYNTAAVRRLARF